MKTSTHLVPGMVNSIFNTAHSTTNNNNNKLDKISQNNLKKIQEHVSTFYSTPQCHAYCQCHICKQKYQVLDKGKQFLRQTSSLIKIDTARIKIFYKMIAAFNNKIAFRLQIPTLCFFDKGQCKLMFKSKNQYVIMQQNHQVSKKNIANFFVQANKKKSDNKSLINKQKDNHIRHFSTVVPSYIHGTNQQNSKMKLAKTFYFHVDNRLQNDQLYLVQKNTSDEVAIVKYLDNKGFQLLNEKQLRQLLKSPTNTACIDFIQSYIKPHEVQSEFLFSQFNVFNPIQNSLMWSRSQIQIKISINIINSYSKDYIPIQTLEAYEQVLKEIPQEYILYQNYKIIHYISLVRNIQINNLTTVWMKDDFKEICFFGIVNFEYEQKKLNDLEFTQNFAIKQMIQKPFSELENELWSMWNKMKNKKLQELQNKQQQRASSSYTKKD